MAVVGAGLFYVSDALIAWNRFVAETRHGRVAIMVTYHLAQMGLVLSLVVVRSAVGWCVGGRGADAHPHPLEVLLEGLLRPGAPGARR